MNELMGLVVKWHHDRNLIDGATDMTQMGKLLEEYHEVLDELVLGDFEKAKSEIGDMLVVLINIVERNNSSLEECLEAGYASIKDRTGMMIDGVFVKQKDLHYVASIDTYVNLKVYDGPLD